MDIFSSTLLDILTWITVIASFLKKGRCCVMDYTMVTDADSLTCDMFLMAISCSTITQ